MRLNHSAILICILVLPLSGCYLRPNFGPPGTIGMQRSRAVLHDPFPSTELGPPIVGGRPRGFDNPQASAENLQEVRNALIDNANTNFEVYPQSIPSVQPSFQISQ